MNKVAKSSERIQTVLNYWFSSSWDRNSQIPGDLMMKWFGVAYDPVKKSVGSSGEEAQRAIDNEIREMFLEDLKLSIIKDESGTFNSWREDPQGLLALVIMHDQFPRNIFRKKPEAFAYESYALELVLGLVKDRQDKKYKLFERVFLYLPLEHSENMTYQDLGLELFTDLVKDYESNPSAKQYLKFMEEHREIIQKFGRFPHRNDILGRISTEEEITYLKSGGARFGQ